MQMDGNCIVARISQRAPRRAVAGDPGFQVQRATNALQGGNNYCNYGPPGDNAMML